MPSETYEHNRLDTGAVINAARELQLLFSESPKLPPFSDNNSFGSPPLRDDIDNIPRQPIGELTDPVPVYAVDGGSSVLAKGGNIELIAWRAGMVSFSGTKRLTEKCSPPEIMACNRLAGPRILSDYRPVSSEKDISAGTYFRLVDELRYLAEWRLAEQIIDEGESDSLLLMDGTLRANTNLGHRYESRLLQRAAEQGLMVAAVTKETRLSQNYNAPLDINDEVLTHKDEAPGVWFRKISKTMDENSIWLGDLYQTRLHPGADKLYLVYVNRFDPGCAARLFSLMAAVSDDVEFAGYPYPLVAAHRLARIDNMFRTEMQDRIEQALEDGGFSPALWSFLKGDIHDKLNADLIALAGGE